MRLMGSNYSDTLLQISFQLHTTQSLSQLTTQLSHSTFVTHTVMSAPAPAQTRTSQFHLYKDALLTVFSFMHLKDLATTACRVCKHWSSVAYSPSASSTHGRDINLLRRIVSSRVARLQFDNLLISPLRLHVRQLVLHVPCWRNPPISSVQLSTLSLHFIHLEALTCDLIPLDDIFDVEYSFPSTLKKLTVNVVDKQPSSSLDRVLLSISKCTSLSCLDLTFERKGWSDDERLELNNLAQLTKLSDLKLLFKHNHMPQVLQAKDWHIIACMPSLTRIDVQRGNLDDNDPLAMLTENVDFCERLQCINIKHVRLNPERWQHICQFKSLTEIHLDHSLGDQGIDYSNLYAPLSSLTRLTHVDVMCSPKVDMESLDSLMITLSRLKELRILKLAHHALSCDHLKRLLPEIPLLASLEVSYCTPITSLSFLSSSRSLPFTLTSLRLPPQLSILSLPLDFFVHLEPLRALTNLYLGHRHNLVDWKQTCAYDDARPMKKNHVVLLQQCHSTLRSMFTELILLNPHCL